MRQTIFRYLLPVAVSVDKSKFRFECHIYNNITLHYIVYPSCYAKHAILSYCLWIEQLQVVIVMYIGLRTCSSFSCDCSMFLLCTYT